MPKKTVSEKMLLKEFRQFPEERWGEVLTFIRSLQPSGSHQRQKDLSFRAPILPIPL